MNFVFLTRIGLCFLCSLLLNQVVFSQTQQKIDSLQQLLLTTTDSLSRAKIYIKIAKQYQHTNPSKALDLGRQALQLLPANNVAFAGKTYNFLGVLAQYLSKPSLAFNYLDSALFFYKKTNNLRGVARVFSNKSMVYCRTHEYTKASEYAYKSLDISEQLNDTFAIAPILSNLLSIDIILKEYPQALKNGKQALHIYQTMKHSLGISSTLYNIGLIYTEMEELDSALLYFDQALILFQNNQNLEYQAIAHSNKSNIYKIQKKLDLALESIKKAIAIEDKIQSKTHKMHLKIVLAAIQFEQGNYPQSIKAYTNILDTAQQIHEISYQRQALEGLVNNYIQLRDFEKAFYTQNKTQILADSILNSDKQQQIKELEIKYETEKKEQENSLLAQEKELETLRADRNRQLVYLSFLAITLILVISFLLMRQYKINAQHLTNQLKHRLLRNQMSPHFIFNSLVAIQNYVYQKEPLQAGEYLASFATLIRTILENSMEEYISLEKEIQWLNNYFKLQLLRFDNSFEYNIQVDEAIDLDNMLIPPMLTQPFIENALEHGLKNINYKGKVTVNITIKDQILHIEVKDNGIGLENSLASPSVKTHKSLAVKITKDRLHFLNKKRGNKIYFDMKGLENKGTLVSFSLPLSYKY
ncbi:tetratricopeptide repeat-containing sensor histidine kinase [Aureispira anguillae]|uniref:Histidine kinase n=1 Tax=Aureispira anguillae TaxID=2864201 RepID=A0A916DRP6_9BACT|nr:histidine kinase [Aureispira anguillae]BDS10765.1 histidine kinase [Aureispira anguillae]